MDPFIGEIRALPYSYAPVNWAYCNGQLLSISQNQTLFSLLGITYGGDGVNNFALPNLQGRAAIHAGSGSGLTPRYVGQQGGYAQVSLVEAQIPNHTHLLQCTAAAGSTNAAQNDVLADTGSNSYQTTASSPVKLSAQSLATTGTGASHQNLQPYLPINYCISLQGVFPSRS
jgi:microcystin-dependent protein